MVWFGCMVGVEYRGGSGEVVDDEFNEDGSLAFAYLSGDIPRDDQAVD